MITCSQTTVLKVVGIDLAIKSRWMDAKQPRRFSNIPSCLCQGLCNVVPFNCLHDLF